MRTEPILTTDSDERKKTPMYSGLLAYFPLALAAVARVSQRGNDKHNPNSPLVHDRSKSTDHRDCIARHLVDFDTFNEDLGEYEDAAACAWRALAALQELEERRTGKGLPPGAVASVEPYGLLCPVCGPDDCTCQPGGGPTREMRLAWTLSNPAGRFVALPQYEQSSEVPF